MVSTQFLTGVLALLAANAVSAKLCKLSYSTVYTTTTVETTATETSSTTVNFRLSLSTSAETSTTLGTSTTLFTTTTEGPTSSAAASVTTLAAAVERTTNADCDAGTCVATDPNVECSTKSECSILYGGDAPFCSASGNCIGCRGDGDCYGETLYCGNYFCNDAAGHGVAGL